MSKISCVDAAFGCYSYLCASADAWRCGCTWMQAQQKTESVAGEFFTDSVWCLASSSWAVLWTHSVRLINLGAYFFATKLLCFGAFSLGYGQAAYQDAEKFLEQLSRTSGSEVTEAEGERLQARLWNLVGSVCLLAWSVLSVAELVLHVSPGPAAVLFFLCLGVAAKVTGYIHSRWAGEEPKEDKPCAA